MSPEKFHGILDILHIFHDKIPEALTLCRVFRLRSGDLILCFHIWFKIFFSEHGRPAFAFFIDLCRAGPSLCHYCPTHSPDTYNCHITTPLHIAFRNPQENFLIRLNLLLRTPFFRHQYQQHNPRNPGKILINWEVDKIPTLPRIISPRKNSITKRPTL